MGIELKSMRLSPVADVVLCQLILAPFMINLVGV